MLDQNTDRMWYVIGAVIVGAAIILILNGTAPELFASVGESFTNTTNKALRSVHSLSYTGTMTDYKAPPMPLSKYTLATDEDFKMVQNDGNDESYYRYVGNDDYVIVPDMINGEPVTEYSFMFDKRATPVKGVASDNPEVTSMWNMFAHSKSTTMDLSHLNTENVTNMNNVFAYSDIAKLNIDHFDTSNVTNFNGMFMHMPLMALDVSHFDTSKATSYYGVFSTSNLHALNVDGWSIDNATVVNGMFQHIKVDTLDLSTFDFTKPTVVANNMFDGVSTIKRGYARTQADADILNGVYGKDVFVVK